MCYYLLLYRFKHANIQLHQHLRPYLTFIAHANYTYHFIYFIIEFYYFLSIKVYAELEWHAFHKTKLNISLHQTNRAYNMSIIQDLTVTRTDICKRDDANYSSLIQEPKIQNQIIASMQNILYTTLQIMLQTQTIKSD